MNDRAFVADVVDLLDGYGVPTWIFGGWGEELRGLIHPREHADLDLLYPGETWEHVDRLPLAWLPGKRFPWKRAFVLDGTTVELFLVQRDERGWHTNLARRRHDWPDDVLIVDGPLRIAGPVALAGFRHSYRVETAA